MAGDQRRLHAVGGEDPIWRLWRQLPEPWKRPVIGDGIADWEKISENGERRIDLTGLPDPIPAELAWMSHWQGLDGTRSSVLGTNQLANILRRAIRENHPVPASIRAMNWETASAFSGGSMPPAGAGCRRTAASPGCGSSSASPAWPCSPAATRDRGGRWISGTLAAIPGSRWPSTNPRPTTAVHPPRSAIHGCGMR